MERKGMIGRKLSQRRKRGMRTMMRKKSSCRLSNNATIGG
jgi:hypothetical protein